jgi:acetoacetate decarboxylase
MPQTRYDMPVLFGPSPMPDMTHVPRAEAIVIPFETTREAAARLLPRHFRVADKPTVSVSRIDYHDVDYLGGRGYREVVISVAASFDGAGGRIDAAYAPVLWVSEVAALIGGREYMGLAKLPAEMDEVAVQDDVRHFACTEYGASLISGEVRGMTALSGEKLERLRRGASEVRTFGWKYIPSAAGVPDTDYPLINSMRWDYERAWSGDGHVTFHDPDARAAPLSSRVLAVLRELPNLGWRRAFVGEGRAIIDRTATRRLLSAPSEATHVGEYGVAF